MQEHADTIRALGGMVGAAPPKPAGAVPTLDELADSYYRTEGRFKRSRKEVRTRTKMILNTMVYLPGAKAETRLGDAPITAITVEFLADLREVWKLTLTRYKRPTSAATRNRMVALVRRWFAWGSSKKPAMPHCTRLERVAMEEEDNVNRSRVQSEKALTKLLESCRAQGGCGQVLEAYVLALHDSGPREMELLGLEWDDWDHQTGRQGLLEGDTKGKGARVIIHSARARQKMLALPRVKGCPHVFVNVETGKRYSAGWITNVFKKAAREAGMPTLTLHKLRHTFTYNARVKWKLSESTVKEILGHKTDAAFRRYGIVDRSEVIAAFKERDRQIEEEDT